MVRRAAEPLLVAYLEGEASSGSPRMNRDCFPFGNFGHERPALYFNCTSLLDTKHEAVLRALLTQEFGDIMDCMSNETLSVAMQ